MKPIYLQITPFFPSSTNFRGVFIYDQVVAIQNTSDFEVVVIKIEQGFDSSKSYEYEGVKCHVFKIWDLPGWIFPGFFHYFNCLRFLRFLKGYVKVDSDNIEFVHSHVTYPAGYLAVFLKKKFGIKSIVQHHGLDVYQLGNGRVLKGTLRKINQQFYINKSIEKLNIVDLNVGVSKKVIYALQEQNRFRNTNFYVFYNGVDLSKFFPKKQSIDNDKFIIGCVANFWELKDQITLIKAVEYIVKKEKYEDIIVIFIGNGPTFLACKKYIEEKKIGNYFDFRNTIHHEKLNDFYNAIDLFVLPSYYEALGCVYLEAYVSGVPFIGVYNQGIEELIKESSRESALIEKGDYLNLHSLILKHKDQEVNLELKSEVSINIENLAKEFLFFIKNEL